jgi:hypothetical protein
MLASRGTAREGQRRQIRLPGQAQRFTTRGKYDLEFCFLAVSEAK